MAPRAKPINKSNPPKGEAQARAILASGGGDLAGSPHKKALCDNFQAAVDDFCDPAKRKGRSFDDCFHDNLQSGPNASAYSGMTSEAGAIFGTNAQSALNRPGTFQGIVAGVSSVGSGSSALTRTARGLQTVASTATGATAAGYRLAVVNGSRNVWGMTSRYQTFADGFMRVPGGRDMVLELKGPNDSFHDFQGSEYQAMRKTHDVFVLTCQSCNASCAPGNTCP